MEERKVDQTGREKAGGGKEEQVSLLEMSASSCFHGIGLVSFSGDPHSTECSLRKIFLLAACLVVA